MRASVTAVAALAVGAGLIAGCAGLRERAAAANARSVIATSPACENFSFPLYFRAGSDQLTRAGMDVVQAYSGRARACPVAEVRVTGLSDVEGSAAQALDLSRRRAATVARMLAAGGYPAPVFDVRGVGRSGLSRPATRDPLRRRAEVTVIYAPTAPPL